MAGAGIRVFQPGEVLSAATVNTYLMDQAVTRFADATARDAAFGSVGNTSNLPVLSEGRVCYLDSINLLQYYSGSAWVSISAEAISGAIVAKGDLIVGTAPSTVGRLPVGSNGYYMIADSTTASGLSWAASTIADGTIVNASINASAAISYSKLNLVGLISESDLAAGAPRAGFRSVQNAATTTSSNYTVQLTDLGKLVELNEASACTLTVPTNASVAFTVGDRIDVLQVGAGQVTITPVSGTVTINGYDGGLKLNGQWAAATLIKRATNTWVAVGNLTT